MKYEEHGMKQHGRKLNISFKTPCCGPFLGDIMYWSLYAYQIKYNMKYTFG